MENIINFVLKYYILLLIITIFLIIALIGYFIDRKRKKSIPFLMQNEDIDLSQLSGKENVSLQEMVNKSQGISSVNMATNETPKNTSIKN